MKIPDHLWPRISAAMLAGGIQACREEVEAILIAIDEPQPSMEDQLKLVIRQFETQKLPFFPRETPQDRAKPNQPFYARFRKRERRSR
jgi:hypothetical protein